MPVSKSNPTFHSSFHPSPNNTTIMNKKLTALLLGLATSGLVSFAQDHTPPAAPPPADNVKPAEAAPAPPHGDGA